jgi:hypothetical protein
VLHVPIPKSRDPFVNACLVSLGVDRSGIERFWISSWNGNVGCMGMTIDERGECRIYRFGERFPGFYSVAQEDERTLWLCGFLNTVVRLDLVTGEHRSFATGLADSLVFQGMTLDRRTNKLFAASFSGTELAAFSFDIRESRTVKTFRNFTPEHYMRFSFPASDGTHSFVMHCPGISLVHWDPVSECIETTAVSEGTARPEELRGTMRLIADDAGRRYFPGRGWFDPITRSFDPDGPRPDREMCWFARRGHVAFGATTEDSNAYLGTWDLKTGSVRTLCTVADASAENLNLAASGKILCVSLYGVFTLHDAETGVLEISKHLPTDAVGTVDCLCRIDRRRLLGTPFITQRFWEADVATGRGYDCGRAAPGCGEVLLTWKIRNKVYLAAYGGGELVEYDPEAHPHFPENPRVVADPPRGMRPVAQADDGRNIFYSSSAPYGTLGSTLTKYDTRTGRATYAENPLPRQQIRSLWHDRRTDTLIAGTTLEADCASCPPEAAACCVARLDAGDMTVIASRAAPKGFSLAHVVGPLDKGTWLCALGTGWRVDARARWFRLDGESLDIPPERDLLNFPEGMRQIVYSGRPGCFLLLVGDRVELWDMCGNVRLRPLARYSRIRQVIVQDSSAYVVRPKEVVILEDCLKGLR